MANPFPHLKDIQFGSHLCLKDIMKGFQSTAIYTGGKGFGVIVDCQRRCIGVITDGDIRSALVSGASIETPVTEAMNRNFVSARAADSAHQILRLFDQRVRQIPIISANGHLIDLYQFSDFDASKREEEKVIRSRSPVRISFGGGGTDMSYFFREKTGYVLSSTINKYCYASICVRPDTKIKLTSKDYKLQVEAESLDQLTYDGKLDLIKACVKVMNPSFGFELETYSEVEPGTGLGGSASISSAIIGAFNHFRNENHLDRYHLADLAYQTERIELEIAGGWQDQYATVFGGLNLIEFRKNEVIVIPLRIHEDVLLELHFNLLLFRFGEVRESGKIVKDQQQQFNSIGAPLIDRYDQLARLTLNMKDELLKGTLRRFGVLLDEAWQIKKTFSGQISNTAIDTLYDEAKRAGALGGKLLGAGGGGYLLIYCEPAFQSRVTAALLEKGASRVNFDFVESGLQTWTAKK